MIRYVNKISNNKYVICNYKISLIILEPLEIFRKPMKDIITLTESMNLKRKVHIWENI